LRFNLFGSGLSRLWIKVMSEERIIASLVTFHSSFDSLETHPTDFLRTLRAYVVKNSISQTGTPIGMQPAQIERNNFVTER
jgi:hypothetical protein